MNFSLHLTSSDFTGIFELNPAGRVLYTRFLRIIEPFDENTEISIRSGKVFLNNLQTLKMYRIFAAALRISSAVGGKLFIRMSFYEPNRAGQSKDAAGA